MDRLDRANILRQNRLHGLKLEILKQLGKYPLDILAVPVSVGRSTKQATPEVSVTHETGPSIQTTQQWEQSSSLTSPAQGTLELFPTGTLPMFTWKVKPTTLGAK